MGKKVIRESPSGFFYHNVPSQDDGKMKRSFIMANGEAVYGFFYPYSYTHGHWIS